MSGKPNDKKDGNSKRQKKNELGERVEESSSEHPGEETSELQVSSLQESKEQTNPTVTRSPESASKNIPEIKIQDTDTSAHLEQASTSSTGAIPKIGKLGKITYSEESRKAKDKNKAGSSKTSVPVQSKQDLESDEDGTSLLYPQSQNKPRSSKNYGKGLSPVKMFKNLFSKKGSEDIKSGPTTRSQSKGRESSESSESEKDDAVGELTDLTRTKKSKKRSATRSAEPTGKKGLFGGKLLSAGLSSKKPRKSKDILIGSSAAPDIHDLLEPISVSLDDSSECLPTQLTEELDVSSLSTDDVISPLSQLSTDSPVRKVLDLPDQEPETEKDKESSSESET